MNIPAGPGSSPDPHGATTELARLAAALSGRYAVERVLGAGGMATVYLAYDPRHHRPVAIKVLHADVTAVLGAERFLSEIRTTANLQHPHILGLIDSGEANGVPYYVMPFVEGESLRDRLLRERQLPVPDAVRITREVASALDYAHRHGVVHRDIKPANILLQDGNALVADFGIALAVTAAGGQRLTQTGLSLGTPQYMSPEQALGEKEIDQRADIYALGTVAYEMLAGEPPFTGPSVQAILARVMTEEPRSLTAERRSVPPAVHAAIHRALEKLPADRFASARDFADALTATAPPAATAPARGTPRLPAMRAVPLALILGAAAVVAAAGWIAWYRASRPRASAPASRLALLAPELGAGFYRQLTLTPDGAAVTYMSQPAHAAGDLLRERLDEDSSVRIAAPFRAGYAPSYSSDGRWIASRDASGNVIVFPASGTSLPVRPLAQGYAFYAWHPDGSLWIDGPPYRALERLIPGSDSLQPMLATLEDAVGLQQILDDGRTAIEIRPEGERSGECGLLDLRNGKETPLAITRAVQVRYTEGYLVWLAQDHVLRAQPFDEHSRRLSGTPVTIAAGVSISGTAEAQFDVAPNGTVAYVPEEPSSLVLVDRDGAERPATAERHDFHMPRFSPDGRQLTVNFATPDGSAVWLLDLSRQSLTRVTFGRRGYDATWLPDGRSITYTSSETGVFGIYRTRPGSMAPPEALILSNRLSFTGEWLPDASGLVTIAENLRPGSDQDIAIVRNGGRGPIEPLVATRFREDYPALSHDGKWLAFVSDASGRDQVYVRPMGDSTVVVQASQDGGTEPVWARDGHELFYRGIVNGEAALVDATVATAPSFAVRGRRALFSMGDYVPAGRHANYDVSPDGRWFAVIKQHASSRIIVLQNLPRLVARLEIRQARSGP